MMTMTNSAIPFPNADSILKTVPSIKKTSEILKLFTGPFRRPKLDNYLVCTAAHGTSLSAVLSALMNSNGNLVSIQTMHDLDITRTSGCTPAMYLGGGRSNIINRVVCGADLSFGAKAVETVGDYASLSSGGKVPLKGAIGIQNTFIARIPAVVLGDLVDTKGDGATFTEGFMNPANYSLIQPGNPLYGKSEAEILEIFVDQVAGDKLTIRKILVENPGNPHTDNELLELVKTVVERIVMELKKDQPDIDYSDIRFGIMREELASFKEAMGSRRDVSRGEIIAHFFR